MRANEYSNLMRTLAYAASTRQLGNTTALVELLKNNPKAVLIVSDQAHASRIARDNQLDQNRVISVNSLDKLRGRNDVYPVFDNYALVGLFAEASRKTDALIKVTKVLKEVENEL